MYGSETPVTDPVVDPDHEISPDPDPVNSIVPVDDAQIKGSFTAPSPIVGLEFTTTETGVDEAAQPFPSV